MAAAPHGGLTGGVGSNCARPRGERFVTGENPCYDWGMSRDTQALLEAFEHLPAEEKRAFTEELLRRSLPFDSGPLEDEEIGAASAALFESLEEKDADPQAR